MSSGGVSSNESDIARWRIGARHLGAGPRGRPATACSGAYRLHIGPAAVHWTGFYIGLNAGGGFGSSTGYTCRIAEEIYGRRPHGRRSNWRQLPDRRICARRRRRHRLAEPSRRPDWRHLCPRRGWRLFHCQHTARHDPWPGRLCSPAHSVLRHRRRRLHQRQTVYGSIALRGGTEAGWTAGAGIEYAITENWTTKLEYLYASFQNATCNAGSCGGLAPASVSFNENIVRLGVNYKF